jgi:methanogenic corrinoid protein MtbC1
MSEAPTERLFRLLFEGKAREARALVLSLYLEGHTVAEIADGSIRTAMERLGEIWKHDQTGICIEHCATDICIQAVQQLRLIVEPQEAKAVAIGGAIPCDPYLLPTLLAATALAAEGWRTVNLGPDTPFDAMFRAIEVHNPRLVWLAISSICDVAEVDRGIDLLAQRLSARGATLALGGRALPSMTGLSRPNVHCCRSLADLISVSEAIQNGTAAKNSDVL